MKEHKKKIAQEYDLTYLNQLSEKENIKHTAIYNQTIYDIMINLKNTINDILNDLIIDIVHFQFNINIFFKDGRMFYLGLIFLFIGLLLYMFNLLFEKLYLQETII